MARKTIMKRLFSIVCALSMLTFVACTDDNNGGDTGEIVVPPTQQENLSQEIGASTTEGSGVTFTTTGAWTSTIKSVRSGEADWVAITPDHGDAAGTYTIAITLTPNETGEERRAEIIITCGETKIVITIVQSATDEPSQGGDEPSQDGNVVQFGSFPGPKIKALKQYRLTADGELDELLSTRSFKYEDSRGLLTEVTQRWGDGEYDYEKYTFTYPTGTDTKLVMKCDQWYVVDGINGAQSGYEYDGYENIMTLNEKGYIVSFYNVGDEDEVGTLEYDEDQLVRLNYGDCGHTEYRWDTWTMVYQKYDEMGDGQYVREHTFTPSYLYGNSFWHSQVDPTVMCEEEVGVLLPWAFGLAGGHNQALYDSISRDGGDITISFEYEFDGGEQVVMGNTVPLISRVTTSYSLSDGTSYRECYLFEYYAE